MRWSQIKKFLPIIGIGLFVYLIIKLNVVKIFKEIENANLYYLAIAIIFIGVYFIFQTLKWFVIAREQKINLSFGEAFKINFVANFYGFITPAKIGSIIRIDYLKSKGDTGRGLSNFVIDKVLDFSSLFILVIGFGLIFYRELVPLGYMIFIIAIFVLLIAISLIFYKKNSTKPILKFFYRILIPNKLKERSRELFNSFYNEMPSLGFLFFVLIINLFTWIINYTSMYFTSLALGINIGFVPFLAIVPISTLVAMIPITINGFGTREATMIGLFGLFGIEAIKVFSMSVLNILIANVIPSLIAMILLFKRERK